MLKMFTVYDSKAEIYLRPFSMRSTGEAVRGFITTLNDQNTEFAKYPADFTLFEIGEFNETTCEINLQPHLINLGNGLALKNKGVMENEISNVTSI